MFWVYTYNGAPFNTWPIPLGESVSDFYSFDWYGLCNANIKVLRSDIKDIPSIDFQTYNAPRVDWWGILAKFYDKKEINMTLWLKAASNSALLTAIDELKYRLSTTWWIFKMNYNGVFRQLSATVTSMKFPPIKSNDFVAWPIEVVMESLEPHFYNTTKETTTIEWITWDTQNEITNSWTVESYPIIYLLFGTGIAGLTSIDLEIGWYTISISETITDSDILIIDSENKNVTLNWTDIDYDWPLPVFDVGTNIFEFTFTPASTVSMSMIAIYKKNYL